MRVQFVRTGERRYAVVVDVPGAGERRKEPAPGYDPHIPHDLVHYVLEAELGLHHAVFGRLAAGGGDFVGAPDGRSRDRARARRRQGKREQSLRRKDHASDNDMERAERLVAVVDVWWRRRQGQNPDVARTAPDEPGPEDAAALDRVADRLDAVAPLWSALPIGGSIEFLWPSAAPTYRRPSDAHTR